MMVIVHDVQSFSFQFRHGTDEERKKKLIEDIMELMKWRHSLDPSAANGNRDDFQVLGEEELKKIIIPHYEASLNDLLDQRKEECIKGEGVLHDLTVMNRLLKEEKERLEKAIKNLTAENERLENGKDASLTTSEIDKLLNSLSVRLEPDWIDESRKDLEMQHLRNTLKQGNENQLLETSKHIQETSKHIQKENTELEAINKELSMGVRHLILKIKRLENEQRAALERRLESANKRLAATSKLKR